MKSRILAGAVILGIGLFAALPQASSVSPSQALGFEIGRSSHWVEDLDSELPSPGCRHFTLASQSEIDLNLSPPDTTTPADLERLGLPEFAKQVIDGKNIVSRLFGVGEASLLKSESSDSHGLTIVTLQSRQKLAEGNFITIDRYFLTKRGALHAALRWPEESDEAAKKSAEQVFDDLRVSGLD